MVAYDLSIEPLSSQGLIYFGPWHPDNADPLAADIDWLINSDELQDRPCALELYYRSRGHAVVSALIS
jgi:hypothetical protein